MQCSAMQCNAMRIPVMLFDHDGSALHLIACFVEFFFVEFHYIHTVRASTVQYVMYNVPR